MAWTYASFPAARTTGVGPSGAALARERQSHRGTGQWCRRGVTTSMRNAKKISATSVTIITIMLFYYPPTDTICAVKLQVALLPALSVAVNSIVTGGVHHQHRAGGCGGHGTKRAS
jgi:hypothetical protein